MEAKATDYLANERTFLAYLRTALASVAFGFVIARFAVFIREFTSLQRGTAQKPVTSISFGIVMVAAGIAIAAFGYARYAAVARGIAEGRPAELSVRAAGIIVAVLGAFGLVVAYILFRVPQVL